MFAGRRPEAAEETLAQVRAVGGEAQFMKADVSRSADTDRMVRACIEAYGGLDYVYNNAGIDGVPMVSTADCGEDVWNEVIATNLTGMFLSMKYEIPALLRRGGGVIVNMSSVGGLREATFMTGTANPADGGFLL